MNGSITDCLDCHLGSFFTESCKNFLVLINYLLGVVWFLKWCVCVRACVVVSGEPRWAVLRGWGDSWWHQKSP